MDLPKHHGSLPFIVETYERGRKAKRINPACACGENAEATYPVDEDSLGPVSAWYTQHLEAKVNAYVSQQRAWMLGEEEQNLGLG